MFHLRNACTAATGAAGGIGIAQEQCCEVKAEGQSVFAWPRGDQVGVVKFVGLHCAVELVLYVTIVINGEHAK